MITSLFAWLMLILGCFLIYFNFDIDNHIDVNCKSDLLRKVNKGLLICGMLLVAFSFAILSFPLLCKSKQNSDAIVTGLEYINLYAFMSFLVSIVLIGLSSIMISTINKDCASNSTSPNFVLGIGIFLFFASGGILIKNINPKKKSKGPEPSRSVLPRPPSNFPKTSRA
jgi:hypothetical protein